MAELLLFVTIKEKLQTDSITIDPSIKTILELREWMIEQYPSIENDLSNVIWAKNEEYVELDDVIYPTDVVAIISPVSGG
ncbi:MoaD/ThiS family protein [bacterium LRH843]|nr:MoaD/ThiS family protein [bacterium LRH843]